MWQALSGNVKEAARKTVGYKKKRISKKPWVNEEMVAKMEERRKWKNINTEEGKRNYRKLNNELRRETEKARETWMREECEEIERL